MRIMLDTNILISMIFFPSEQTKTLAEYLGKNCRILLCDYVIDELRLVIKRKFRSREEFLERFLRELPHEKLDIINSYDSEIIPPIRDKKDAPILAAAILEEADILITGDKDFLVLNVEHPEILTMTEFLLKYSKK